LILGGGDDEVPDAEAEKRIAAAFEETRTESEVLGRLDEYAAASPAESRLARAAAVRRLSAPSLERQTEHTLLRFAPLLEPNPRAMKRFINAYGVERALQIRRPCAQGPLTTAAGEGARAGAPRSAEPPRPRRRF
jgi:hypothetical protein